MRICSLCAFLCMSWPVNFINGKCGFIITVLILNMFFSSRIQHEHLRRTSALCIILASHRVKSSWSWMLEGRESRPLAGPCVGCLPLFDLTRQPLTTINMNCDTLTSIVPKSVWGGCNSFVNVHVSFDQTSVLR